MKASTSKLIFPHALNLSVHQPRRCGRRGKASEPARDAIGEGENAWVPALAASRRRSAVAGTSGGFGVMNCSPFVLDGLARFC